MKRNQSKSQPRKSLQPSEESQSISPKSVSSFGLAASGIATLAAIAVIAVLEFVALSKGIDGFCLGLSIAAVSGLGGYNAKSIATGIASAVRKRNGDQAMDK